METVARNRVTLTTSDYREWLGATYLKSLNSIALSVALLLGFVCAILLTFDIFFHVANRDIMVAVASFAAALLLIRLAVPLVSGYCAFCRAAHNHNGAPGKTIVREVVLYGDRIEAYEEGACCIVMRYDEVNRIDQTAHLIVFNCKDKNSLLVRKDAFSSEELSVIERLVTR